MDENAHRTSAGVVVLAPAGELDLSVAPRLRALLGAAHRPGADVVLDLADVVFLDSSALAVVLSAEQRLRGSGGTLRLVNVADEVRRVLRICGLAERLLRDRPVLAPVPVLP